MQFFGVFTCRIFWSNQTRFEEPNNEGTGPSKRIEDMNILVGKRASEVFPHGIIGSAENKIHNLNRGVYDTERLGLFLECGLEECFV